MQDFIHYGCPAFRGHVLGQKRTFGNLNILSLHMYMKWVVMQNSKGISEAVYELLQSTCFWADNLPVPRKVLQVKIVRNEVVHTDCKGPNSKF